MPVATSASGSLDVLFSQLVSVGYCGPARDHIHTHFIPKNVLTFSHFLPKNPRSCAHKWGLFSLFFYQNFACFRYTFFSVSYFLFIPVSNTLFIPVSETLHPRFWYHLHPHIQYPFYPCFCSCPFQGNTYTRPWRLLIPPLLSSRIRMLQCAHVRDRQPTVFMAQAYWGAE